MKKRILVILIILFLLIGVVAAVMSQKRRKMYFNEDGSRYEPDLLYFYYNHGASSLGEKYSISLTDFILEFDECEGNGFKEKKKKISIGKELYEKFDEIVDKYHMKDWDEFEESAEFALDGAVTSFSLWFKDGKRIDYGSMNRMDQNEKEALSEILTLLESYRGE